MPHVLETWHLGTLEQLDKSCCCLILPPLLSSSELLIGTRNRWASRATVPENPSIWKLLLGLFCSPHVQSSPPWALGSCVYVVIKLLVPYHPYICFSVAFPNSVSDSSIPTTHWSPAGLSGVLVPEPFSYPKVLRSIAVLFWLLLSKVRGAFLGLPVQCPSSPLHAIFLRCFQVSPLPPGRCKLGSGKPRCPCSPGASSPQTPHRACR